jgi:hypothetical protein
MMPEVDRGKLADLMLTWLEHEHWIQDGCSQPANHKLRVPGYKTVVQQGQEAYAFYRHSFVPYFSAALGYSGLVEDITRLVDDLKAKYPELTSQLLADYVEPDEHFRAQWGNLFDTVLYSGLTHDSLLQYQRKFEVELPLRFLTNIRELAKTGSFDPKLTRFRDRSGNLKKGILVQHVRDGFKQYPHLSSIVKLSYDSKLRNAVGHNAYTISDGRLRSIDGRVQLSTEEFVRRLEALQTLQNTILWLFMSRYEEDRSALSANGIVAIGWGWQSDQKGAHLSIFQLAPFFLLDKGVHWLDHIILAESEGKLITRLGGAPSVEGPMPAELTPILQEVRQSDELHCAIIPVMPCIHQHSPDLVSDGAFCQTAAGVEGSVPTASAA